MLNIMGFWVPGPRTDFIIITASLWYRLTICFAWFTCLGCFCRIICSKRQQEECVVLWRRLHIRQDEYMYNTTEADYQIIPHHKLCFCCGEIYLYLFIFLSELLKICQTGFWETWLQDVVVQERSD